MECPKCKFMQPDGENECVKCGIVFDKYVSKQKQQVGRMSAATASGFPDREEAESAVTPILFSELFLYVKPDIDPFSFIGRVLIFFVIIGWGLKFIFTPMESNYTGESFMHLINLPFHEAGHMLFRLLGNFMTVLGGSLMQLLVPLVCLLTLLLKTRDTFGASVSLWWVGESLMDLAPYINDARDLKLILLGGVTGRDVDDYHDWEFILRELGLLRYDHMLAKTAYFIGTVLMLVTFVWGGFLLYKQFRNINSGKLSLE